MKVGLTGHQEIGSPEDISWVRSELQEVIARESVDLGLTSLAAGSDQLFASVLQEALKPYMVLVPCQNYESTFHSSDLLENYRRLVGAASKVLTLPFREPSEEAFFEAGKKIVDEADLMVAVWDGLPAKGLGGTADVVQYSLEKGKPVFQLNPRTHTSQNLKAP